jgi:hypothetical protein
MDPAVGTNSGTWGRGGELPCISSALAPRRRAKLMYASAQGLQPSASFLEAVRKASLRTLAGSFGLMFNDHLIPKS